MNTVSKTADTRPTGSGFVPNQLLHDPTISVTAKAVYAVVMGMKGEIYSPPDANKIARALGVRRRTVEKAFAELADRGWSKWL